MKSIVSTIIFLVLTMFASAIPSWSQESPARDSAIQAQAIFVRGLTQAYIGNHDVAVSLFLRSLRFDSDNANVLVELSKSYAAIDDLESAVFYAESAASLSDVRDVKENLASLYATVGRPGEAIVIMERLVQESPENPGYRLTLVRYLIGELQYNQAAESLIALPVRAAFDSPIVYDIAAELFVRSSAAGEIDRLITLIGSQDVVALPVVLAMSDVLAAEGRSREAKDLLDGLKSLPEAATDIAERLARLDDSNEPTATAPDGLAATSTTELLERARSLIASDDVANYLEAEHILKQANAGDPTIESSMLLGDLYYKLKRFDEAAGYYNGVLQKEVRIREVWQKSAGALFRAGALVEAIGVASDGLLFFPHDAGLLEILAFASFSSGSDDLSRETFTRAIENVDEDKLRIAVYWMALGNISI
ncbi:MAG: hypothetical protein HKN43_07680, partial [Rhodothermales bacterium]|nr:hypothetical protein [Rhodothermales bacterium]